MQQGVPVGLDGSDPETQQHVDAETPSDSNEGPPSGHLGRGFTDPMTWIVAATSLVVYVLHGFNAWLSRDLAIYAYGAQRVVEGSPPYVGILERTGPLAQLVPAFGVAVGRLFNMDDLFAMRVLFLLLSVACVAMVFVLGRYLFSSPALGLASAAVFLAFQGFIRLATNGPREKTTMVLLILVMLLCLGRRRWMLAAACASLATLAWQPAALLSAVALVLPLTGLRGAERGRAFLRMLVGGLVPVVVVLAYYAVNGAVQDLLNGFLLINLRYTQSTPPQGGLVGVWEYFTLGYGLSAYLIPVGLAGLMWATVERIRRAGRKGWMLDPVVITGLVSLPAIAWTRYDIDGWPDAFVLLPFAAFGMAFLFSKVLERLPTLTLRSAATATWIALGVVYAVLFAVSERTNTLERQRASVAHVFSQLPDATIMSVQAPQALVLSGKTNPTQHQMFQNNMHKHIDATWPGGLDAFVGAVEDDPPTLIVWQENFNQKVGGLRELVAAEYHAIGKVPGWTWYAHNSVPQDITANP